jgi:hypothetical protein
MSDVLVRVRNGETVELLETTLVRKDGTVVPVSLTVAQIRDEDDGPGYLRSRSHPGHGTGC